MWTFAFLTETDVTAIRELTLFISAFTALIVAWRTNHKVEKLKPLVDDNTSRLDVVEPKADEAVMTGRKLGSMTGLTKEEAEGE